MLRLRPNKKCDAQYIVSWIKDEEEYAQHFYNKLGYAAIGGFLLGTDPYEVILAKQI